MMKLRMLFAVTIALLLAGSLPTVWSQTVQLLGDRPITARCFQNGQEIFVVGPLKSLSQVGVERLVEFVTTDGQPRQIRTLGTATCLITLTEP